MNKKVNILNKKAKFEYQLLDQYNAGIVLTGTEIKSIRLGKASITESFCEFNENNELFIINMFIQNTKNILRTMPLHNILMTQFRFCF